MFVPTLLSSWCNHCSLQTQPHYPHRPQMATHQLWDHEGIVYHHYAEKEVNTQLTSSN